MPQVIDTIGTVQEPAPNRVRWTRQQCQAIYDSGILVDRYELIDGEIISKIGQGPLHASLVLIVSRWLSRLFAEDFIRYQMPLAIPWPAGNTNEPLPDVMALDRRLSDFLHATPGASNVVLLVEVSDTTLRFDMGAKARLYSASGIPDYWVLDLAGRQIYAHRAPSAEGYREVTAYSEHEPVAPLANPAATIRPADLLPPASDMSAAPPEVGV